MKSIALALALALLLSPLAFAEETSGATWTGEPEFVRDWLNENCIDHTHQIPERDDPLGLGVDLVVYEDDNPDAKLEKVTIEEKYDFENDENSIFVVAQVNLFKLFQKKDAE